MGGITGNFLKEKGDSSVSCSEVRKPLAERPLVSVIVPVYNMEKYIGRCIDSILSQTYERLEIILVDDGSTDGSGELCDEYAARDQRIMVIHQKNAGQAAARNRALDVMSGEWSAFVDSDDFICKVFIERMLGYAIVYDADIVSCRWKEGKEDRLVSPRKSLEKDNIKVYSGKECYINYFTSKKLPALESLNVKLFKTALFKDLRFIVGRLMEDMAIMHRLFDRAERVVFADEALYYYFQTVGSTIRGRFNIKKLSAIKSYEERLDYFYEIGGKALWGRALQQYQDTLFRYYYLIRRDCRTSKKTLQAQKILLGKIHRNDERLRRQPNISKSVKALSRFGTFCPYPAGYVSEKLVRLRAWRR